MRRFRENYEKDLVVKTLKSNGYSSSIARKIYDNGDFELIQANSVEELAQTLYLSELEPEENFIDEDSLLWSYVDWDALGSNYMYDLKLYKLNENYYVLVHQSNIDSDPDYDE